MNPAQKRAVVIVAHEVHDRGGMERALAELIRHAHDRFRLTVVACELEASLQPLVRWERIRVPRRPFAVRYLLFGVAAAWRLRRMRGRGVLVHTQGAVVPSRADLASIHLCHRALVDLGVVRGYGNAARRLNAAVSRALALAAERWCYRRGRLRLAAVVSERVGAEMHRCYPGVETVVTPNGVDTQRFRPDAHTRDELRAAQEVAPGQTVVLFVGGDWRLKGLDLVVESVATLRSSGHDAVLWVVGRGNDAWLDAVISSAGASDCVRRFRREATVERFFQAADVFVLPSAYETFSLVAHEAAATGIPVVATRVGGIDELIDAGAGVAVGRSVAAIAGALASLVDDEERRAEIGRIGQRYAAQHTWSKSASSVTSAYDRLFAVRDLEAAS
jgi:glycosyltransferase involved in cell wall biosynthesis